MKDIFLDKNENLYGPAPKCFEVLRSLGIEDLGLYSRDYLRGVKSRLTERLSSDLKIPEQQILLSDGSEDMLKQAVHCYVGLGEKILCPTQSWWYYQAVASEVGGITVKYDLKETSDRFLYDVDEMISLYKKESPHAILIASPNNPTGNSFSDSDLQRLIKSCPESIVILDEAYWGFADASDEHIAALIKSYKNILVLRTFSKYYALAGARIAYAAAGTGLTRLTKYTSHYLGYNRLSEALALAALDSREYYHNITAQIRSDRKQLYDFFDRHSEFTCFRSEANFIFVRILDESKMYLEKELRAHGFMIKFFAESEFKNCIRITLGTTFQNEHLLGVLTEFLAK
jgi:histidinol-phosphate aminotransferase